MKTITAVIFSFFIAISTLTFSQSAIELTFTGQNAGSHIDLDSVKVRNINRACDTILYWPDTVLIFTFVGLPDHHKDNEFYLSPAYPNPAIGESGFDVYIPSDGEISIVVSDLQGRIACSYTNEHLGGKHHFSFYPDREALYNISVIWKNRLKSMKIISGKELSSGCRITHSGERNEPSIQAKLIQNEFIFVPGDELILIGYYYGLQSGLYDAPVLSEDYIFEFATNIPCPDAPHVIYEGKFYNTVQIAGQCWMKENLNVGTMIQGNQAMEDNGVIERYCAYNNEDSCDQLGGLYQWEEVMAYENTAGVRGICPPGWHVPTDEEWKILEGATDSQHPIGDPIWDQEGERGYDAGNMLKSTSGWIYYGVGSNKSGYTGIGAGMRNMFGSFTNKKRIGYHWSSSEQSSWIWVRVLSIYGDEVIRRRDQGVFGFSLRCLKDI